MRNPQPGPVALWPPLQRQQRRIKNRQRDDLQLDRIALSFVGQFVAVPAAPVPDARATRIERRKRAVRLSGGCRPSQLHAELGGIGVVMGPKNEADREKHHGDERQL
jgi:hypothetical protein